MLLNKPSNTWNSRTRPYEGASPRPTPPPEQEANWGNHRKH